MDVSPQCDVKCDIPSESLQLESICMRCFKSGLTCLLFTRIPFFREVVVSSFSCPHCGLENRSLDPAAPIQDEGQKIVLNINKYSDLDRKIVRPSGSTIHIPELDASFPNSNGDVSTVEGVLRNVMSNIEALQPERKESDPVLTQKLDSFLDRMRVLLTVEQPFTLVLDDPSGNGCIENFAAPADDPQLTISHYKRTAAQSNALGLLVPSKVDEVQSGEATSQPDENAFENLNANSLRDEVLTFNHNCAHCNALSETHMKLLHIPHFKEVVIMATVCPSCGHKDTEVKSGGGIAPKGRLYRLKLSHLSDLSRDILVSETASIRIPELNFESLGGTLGGRFTTLEGFLVAIKDQLIQANPFIFGDSASDAERNSTLAKLIQKIGEIASGIYLNVQFELKDPTGNSYLQNLYAPDDDPQLEVIEYDRSLEEDEQLGLLDMNTESLDPNETSM